ncbi:MAG: type II secretion system protein GspM [Steroidobacteraceae bacterium]
MKRDPRQWLEHLAPRERRFVLWGAAGCVALALLGAGLRLHHAIQAGEKRIATKTADLAWMQSVAPAVQAAPVVRDGSESLPLLIDRTAREAGLASALAGSEPTGPDGLRVRFNAASFDAIVAWIAALESRYGVGVGGASIERVGSEGSVNATITLHRS